MAAKQSQEMRNAIKLVGAGLPPRHAANIAGVWYTSLYQALKKQRDATIAKSKAERPRVPEYAEVAAKLAKQWEA